MGTMGWSASTSSCMFPPPLSVLVVEPDRACLLELERMLLLCNYRVTCCRDANEAQSLLQSKEETFFDIVLCEVHLPRMSGVRLLKILVHRTDIPVVMISSDLADDAMRRAMILGARDILVKPVQEHSLVHLWRHLLGKEKWRDYIAKILNGNTVHNSAVAHSASELGKYRKVVKEEEIGTSRFPKGTIKVKEEIDDGDTRHASSFLTSASGTVKIKEEIDGDEEELPRRGPIVSSKKPRMLWTPELHQKFVSAVNQLGPNAFPKNIVQVMRVPDLTRRQVANHLQTYRRNLKKAIASSAPLPSVAEMSRPGLAQHQPHPSNAAGYYREESTPIIDLDSDGMDSFLMHQSFPLPNASVSFQAGTNVPFMYPNHSQAISSQCNTRINREKSIQLIDLEIDGTDSFLTHQSSTSPPLIHTNASGSFTLPSFGNNHDSGKKVEGSFYQEIQMNDCFASQDHLIPAQYVNDGVLTDTDTNLGPSVGSGGEATMDSFLKHQYFSSPNIASGSFQAAVNVPLMYPNHSQAISSQCNTRIDQVSDAGFDQWKSIPLTDLEIDGMDFLMHQSSTSTYASGRFTLPSFGNNHDSGKKVEGSFYQEIQMNDCFASQDHLIPAQYVNDGVLTDTDTNIGPSVGSGGAATMDSFLKHQYFSLPNIASGSFQAAMNVPFMYPNHSQAISSQCNTRIDQVSDAGFDQWKSIPLSDLEIDGMDFLMHQSSTSTDASGSFTLPSFGNNHDSGKKVEGSFYQEIQLNHCFPSQDHLIPAQYVNGGVLTDTDTNLVPSIGSGGEATMDCDNNSGLTTKASPLDQSSHVTNNNNVGTSQSMETNICDELDD